MASVINEPIVVRLTVPVKNMPIGTELGYKDVADAIAALGSAAFFEVVRTQDGDPIPPLTPEEIEEAQRAAQRRAKSRRLILGADLDPIIPGPDKVVVGTASGTKQVDIDTLGGDVDPALVSERVTEELEGRNLVESHDPRLPRQEDAPDDLLVTVTDRDGRRTWLEASEADGGPTDWALQHLHRHIGVAREPDITNILASLVDANGVMTDLTVRASDGQFADFVIDRLAARLAGKIAGGGVGHGDYYVRGDEVLPVRADTSHLVAWGSSSALGIAPSLVAALAGTGMAVVSKGTGGERTHQIAARMGAIPALLTFPSDTIPASGSATVTVSNMPYGADKLRAYPGTVSGVHGTLAWNGTALTFARTTAGDATPSAPDTPMIPDDAGLYRDAATLLWAGKNDLWNLEGSWQEVVDRTDTMFDWLAPLHVRTLVLGHFVNTGTPAVSSRREWVTATNAAHAARYGPLYVDVPGFLASSDLWDATGLTPTADDLDEQALGNLPPSVTDDGAHLTAAGYSAVAALITDQMTALGWI